MVLTALSSHPSLCTGLGAHCPPFFAHEESGLHPLTLVPGLFNMINIPPVNELLVAAVAALEQTLSWVSRTWKKQL